MRFSDEVFEFNVYVMSNRDEEIRLFLQGLAGRIKHFRKMRGLTQDNLAEKVDRTLDVISHTERVKTVPRVDLLFEIAEALDCDVVEFFLFPIEKEPTDHDRLVKEVSILIRSLPIEKLQKLISFIELDY